MNRFEHMESYICIGCVVHSFLEDSSDEKASIYAKGIPDEEDNFMSLTKLLLFFHGQSISLVIKQLIRSDHIKINEKKGNPYSYRYLKEFTF